MEMDRGWIAVDLDGTLARYEGWVSANHIGDPVPEMLERVKAWLAGGRRVKIFTARAMERSAIPPIHRWLERHGLPALEVTNVKDYDMIELWDDRCVRIVKNTGRRCCEG